MTTRADLVKALYDNYGPWLRTAYKSFDSSKPEHLDALKKSLEVLVQCLPYELPVTDRIVSHCGKHRRFVVDRMFFYLAHGKITKKR